MTGLEGGASAFGNPPVHPLILVQTTAKIPAFAGMTLWWAEPFPQNKAISRSNVPTLRMTIDSPLVKGGWGV